MSWQRGTATVGVLCAGLALSACSEVKTESKTYYKPSTLSSVAGTKDIQRVTLTEESAGRIGLRTATVRVQGKLTVVPSPAVIYSAKGLSYVYTAPTPLTFLRAEVKIVADDGRVALLSDGPPAGTQVVTTGATEVYGTEFKVGS